MDKSKFDPFMEPLARLISYLRENNIILWAGSGLSLYAGYLSGADLCKKILESARDDDREFPLERMSNKWIQLSCCEEYRMAMIIWHVPAKSRLNITDSQNVYWMCYGYTKTVFFKH